MFPLDNLITTTLLPEFHNQKCVILTWPHKNTDWRSILNEIESTFLDIVKNISENQLVIVIAYNHDLKLYITKLFKQYKINLSNIIFILIPSNDTWVRDYGCISTAYQSKLLLLDFDFNGWGGKYDPSLDNVVNSAMGAHPYFKDVAFHKVPLILEGGSIDTDGKGTLITTTNCLLSDKRNNFTKEQLDQILKTLFNLKRIVWLENIFLAGDDTDGHVDNLVRFINSNTLFYISCNNPNDEHFLIMKKLEQELMSFKNSSDNSYELVPIPLPDPIYNPVYKKQNRLPASYLNFLITNHAILVPVFNQKTDSIVLEIFKHYIKNKEIIGINASLLITQGGGIHCSTMQISDI